MAGSRTRDPERPERILAAAATLIARHGYLGVNLADIGSAAGIVGSGIYRHFDSKAAILVALFDRVVDRLIVDAEESLRAFESPSATLASLVRGQVRFTADERTLCQVYLQESRNLPERDIRRLRWKQRHYVDLWQEVLAGVAPELAPARAQVLVHAAISAIHSSLRYRHHLEEAEMSAYLEQVACAMLGVEPLPVADDGRGRGRAGRGAGEHDDGRRRRRARAAPRRGAGEVVDADLRAVPTATGPAD